MTTQDGLRVAAILHDDIALNGPHDVELQGELAFVAGKWGSFAVVDVSTPADPHVLGSICEGVDNAQTVLPHGDVCFLGTDEFLAIDVSDPTHPAVARRISHAHIARINGMARIGHSIVAANKSGFVDVFDVRRPARPEFVGALDTRAHGGILSPHDLAVFGRRMIVVDQRGGAPLKARLYRIADTDTNALLPIDEWAIEGAVAGKNLDGANRVVVSGPYAYVAANKAGTVGVLDITDPAAPTQIANLPTADIEPDGLTKAGPLLYVGAGQSVEVIDVADPSAPVSAGTCRFYTEGAAGAHDLVVRDGFAYVTAQDANRVAVLTLAGPGR